MLQQRPPRRRRRRAPIVILILIVAIVAAVIAARYALTVRRLTVVGNGAIDANEVARMTGIQVGVSMNAIDVERVRAGVENDGRLAFVSLERQYPGGLVLTVRERAIEAVAMQAGKILAIDGEAVLIAVLDRLPDGNYPYVTGLKPNRTVVGRQLETVDGRVPALIEILSALKAQGAAGNVAEIDVDDLNNLSLTTRAGLEVMLGDRENLSDKIAWTAATMVDLNARGEVGGLLDVTSGKRADYRPLNAVAASAAESDSEEGG